MARNSDRTSGGRPLAVGGLDGRRRGLGWEESTAAPSARSCGGRWGRIRVVQRVQELDRLLRQGGGVEHRPRLVVEQLQPRGDVARVVGPRRRGDAEIGAQERAAEFGDQLLAGVLGGAGWAEVASAYLGG